MLNILKCLTVGAIAVAVADIIVKRALDRAEKVVDHALSRAEQQASNFVNSAVDEVVDLAIDRFEADTGFPLYWGNRHPRLNTLIRHFWRGKGAD